MTRSIEENYKKLWLSTVQEQDIAAIEKNTKNKETRTKKNPNETETELFKIEKESILRYLIIHQLKF